MQTYVNETHYTLLDYRGTKFGTPFKREDHFFIALGTLYDIDALHLLFLSSTISDGERKRGYEFQVSTCY